MAANPSTSCKVLEIIERIITVVRDGVLAALIIAAVVVLWSWWPQLKQQLLTSKIDEVSIGGLSFKLSQQQVIAYQTPTLNIEAVGGPAKVLEKGSLRDLNVVAMQGSGRTDLVGVSDGNHYSGELLLAYISRLSPKYVLFRTGSKLDAWVEAGVFAAQIRNPESYSYQELMGGISGLHRDTIPPTASVREALDRMSKLQLDYLPVVDVDQRFLFLLSREDIVSKVITTLVLSTGRN
jgi:hypothetical protein